MRKKIFAVLMVMSFLIIGALNEPGIASSDTVMSNTFMSEAGVVVFRIEDINTMGGATSPDVGELIQGAQSKLVRTADGISMELITSELPEGAYSIWWAIDNDNDPTTGANPGSPLVEGVEIVRRATGGIVGANGVGKFEATLSAAPVAAPNRATVMINVGGSQVLNPMMARVALVIRFHGPVVLGGVDEQTNLFAGGCNNTTMLGFPGPFPGPNTCFDPQVTEFHVPGISASDSVMSNTSMSEAGVVFFRIEDINTMGGATSPDVGELIQGAQSKLVRTADGISMELITSELPEGAYSIWWAIDNDNDPTTGASPGSPLVEGVEIVRRATGGIVGANGVGKFEATLSAAPVPAPNRGTVLLNVGGSQVLNPMMARVALVIRFHGPVVPGSVEEQTNLFAGGCNNTPTLGLVGAFPGPNTCFDPQVTEFHGPAAVELTMLVPVVAPATVSPGEKVSISLPFQNTGLNSPTILAEVFTLGTFQRTSFSATSGATTTVKVQFTVPEAASAGSYDLRVFAWDPKKPNVVLVNQEVLGAFSIP